MSIDYLKYQKRKLQESLSTSPFGQLRSEISQVGREAQRISRQTEATLKRQDVPLGARVESARQLQSQYTQGVAGAYDRYSQKEAVRKQGVMQELEQVEAQLEILEEEKSKKTLDTAIQVGATALGAGIGLAAGNPLLGAQLGSSAGQLISGGVGIASGDATEQDWQNVGMGLVSGLGTASEAAQLSSIKAENTEAMSTFKQMLENKDMSDFDRKNLFFAISVGASQGIPLNDIMKQWDGLIPPVKEIENAPKKNQNPEIIFDRVY